MQYAFQQRRCSRFVSIIPFGSGRKVKMRSSIHRATLPEHLRSLEWVWSLGGLSIRELARRTVRALVQEETLGRAAELSYYFVLALFPLLICISSAIGLAFSNNQELYERAMAYAQTVMPQSAYQTVRAAVSDLTEGASRGKLSLALVFALWTASLGMDAAIKGLNVAYDIREFRPWWKRRLVAIGITLLLIVLLLAALLLILVGDAARQWLASSVSPVFLEPVWAAIQWLTVVVFMLAGLSVTYLLGPNLKEQRWRAILPGSMIAFLCWIGASLGFRLYLKYFDSYSGTYGSLGAVIVLLLWLYLSGASILIGGEVNAQIRHAAADAGSPEARRISEARDA
jgi:membrane protein